MVWKIVLVIVGISFLVEAIAIGFGYEPSTLDLIISYVIAGTYIIREVRRK